MDLSWIQQLSGPAKLLLLGSAANMAGGLAAGVVKSFLNAAGYQVKKLFQSDPKEKALILSMAQALHATVEAITSDRDEEEHFLDLFGQWLKREAVSGELSQVIAPRPDTVLDLQLLRQEFEAAGYAANMLGKGRKFEEIVSWFVRAFSDAAALQPELHDQIEIGLLRGLVERSDRQLLETRKQTESLKRLEQRLAPDMSSQKQNYLRRLSEHYRFLPLMGLDVHFSDATKGPDRRIQLADVYIHMTVTDRGAGFQEHPMGERVLREEKEKAPLKALAAFVKSRRMVLLGDPGGGKSTFVNHLVFCLTSHQLAPEEAWLKHLPDWPGPWADMLPVPVVLREVAAWIQSEEVKHNKTGLFLAYLRHWLKERGLEDYFDFLHSDIKNGGALLLLDGFDEVSEEKALRTKIKDAVSDLPRAFPESPMLLTCRVLSYKEAQWQLDRADWPMFELDQLDEDQINGFITAWYQQLSAMCVSVPPGRSSEKLLQALGRSDLWPLAQNPLLLTVMAIVHTHRGGLPDTRTLLYKDVVELLLLRWEDIKVETMEGAKTSLRQLLQEAGLGEIDLKEAIWEIAFKVHEQGQEAKKQDALADISETLLLNTLRTLHPKNSLDWAEQMVKIMKLRAGLLKETRPKVYAFPHRTFQEYLAGRYLGTLPDFTDQSMALAGKGVFWWEVILLAVGSLVHSAQFDPPLVLTSELCREEAPKKADHAGWRRVWLAGKCMLEIGPSRATRRNMGKKLIERIPKHLTHLITHDALSPAERAEAGSVLSAMGDPRNLDEMVPVSPGKFLMGTTKSAIKGLIKKYEPIERLIKAEGPQSEVYVKGFRISRYPVTNGQYARFVEKTRYEPPLHWKGRVPADGLCNHPVVYVSLHDARAYCAWLTEKRGQEVRLPTEAEWEKAARGKDGRIYPWGNAFERERCNSFESGIGGTCPVGIFSKGISPFKCMDMSGNVWEWTESLWGEDWEKTDFPYPYDPEDGRERREASDKILRVLRGGAFDYFQVGVRCALRYWDYPDHRYFIIGFRVASPGL